MNETGDRSVSRPRSAFTHGWIPFRFRVRRYVRDGGLRRDEEHVWTRADARRALLMREQARRLRATLEGLRSHRHDDSNDECGKPWMLVPDPPLSVTEERTEPEVSPRRSPPAPPLRSRNAMHVEQSTVGEGDGGLVPALHRVADAFEKLADGLEADRRERSVRLDAMEALVRELVTGLAQPAAVRPIVVGGTIDLSDPAPESVSERRSLSGRAGVDGGVDTA